MTTAGILAYATVAIVVGSPSLPPLLRSISLPIGTARKAAPVRRLYRLAFARPGDH
jgi:hypothetical protein